LQDLPLAGLPAVAVAQYDVGSSNQRAAAERRYEAVLAVARARALAAGQTLTTFLGVDDASGSSSALAIELD
jgi:hypothetical protein